MGLEAALLGTAAVGTAGTAGATAATAGLLGAGGAFSLGTTLATLGTIGGVIGAGSSIIGGIQQQDAADQAASAAEASSIMAGKESARQAVAAANEEKTRADQVRRAQKLAYIKSGVSLEGSPLLVMEQTRQTGLSNVDEILSAGASSKTTALTEGRIKAQSLKASGRQAFIQGISGGFSGLSSAAGMYSKMKK